ncbi:hypothetical protein [Cupriavidus necator]|uniref:hypothetical protein n=1 Tax=Cupriavidus necator TaxID=106590 RepID=UPI00277E5554|nr:hypothetical protein [Cupriavidus necator]MDQ0140961.1 hypothetical protein [Cupriavidus necator]
MRLESGYSVERPPLPEMMARETRVKKVGRPRKVHPRLAHKAPLPSRPASEPQQVFVDPPEPKHWHPVLSKVRTELAAEAKNAAQLKAKHDWEQAHPGKQYPSRERIWGSWEYFCDAGQLLGERHRKSPVRLSLNHHRRGLVILNMLCERAGSEGYEVRASDDGSRIQFVKAQAHIDIRVSEKLEVSSRSEVNSWDKSTRQIRRLLPTGRLAVFVEQQGLGHTEVVDRPGQPLEERMDEIARAMTRRYEGSLAAIARWAEQKRVYKEQQARREEEERRRKEMERLAEEERVRRVALVAEAENWQKADLLRRYVASLDARIKAGGQLANADEYPHWREWALQVAHELDSSLARVGTPGAPQVD